MSVDASRRTQLTFGCTIGRQSLLIARKAKGRFGYKFWPHDPIAIVTMPSATELEVGDLAQLMVRYSPYCKELRYKRF